MRQNKVRDSSIRVRFTVESVGVLEETQFYASTSSKLASNIHLEGMQRDVGYVRSWSWVREV